MSTRKVPNIKRTKKPAVSKKKKHAKRNLIIAGTVLLLFIAFIISVSQNTDKDINTDTNNTDTNKPNTNTAVAYNSETDFEYGWDKNVKDGIAITKYVGKQKEVRIPPSIQNLKVTSIGAGAFIYNRNITSVTIPNSVTSIEDSGKTGGAFADCPSLVSVTIPNSVTIIGTKAFFGCTSLAGITIPNSVTSIGNDAFNGCTSLAKVTIGNSVTTIGKNAFTGCTSLASITIPRSVTRIEAYAFKDCKNLTSVTFQGAIVRKEFGALGQSSITGAPVAVDLFPGDLTERYLDTDGGPGTYTRLANGQKWRKQ
jgi:hypothetical protein